MTPTSALLDPLRSCLRDAADRTSLGLEVGELSSVEGTYFVVSAPNAEAGTTPLAIVDAVDPFSSPFDDVVRDRARNVASRAQAPYIIITSLRTIVVYRTDAVTRRLPIEQQVVMQLKGASVSHVASVLAASNRVAITEALRITVAALVRLPLGLPLGLPAGLPTGTPTETPTGTPTGLPTGTPTETPTRIPPVTPEVFFVERLNLLLDDLLAATDGSVASRQAIDHLTTAVVSYLLVQMHHSETLDPLTLPYGLTHPHLMLDIIGAFLRDARQTGHLMFPETLDVPKIDPQHAPLFRMALAELVSFVQSFDLARLDASARDHVVDAILQWCMHLHGTPVPTLDAIDMAIVAAGIADRKESTPLRVLEIGSTMGTFGIRTSLVTEGVDARVYAANGDEQRMILLRASGQLGTEAPVRIVPRHEEIDHDWDVVCLSLTAITERRRLSLLLHQLRLAPHAPFILFVPLAVLRDKEYADVREHLVQRFDVQWIFTSDADPMAVPDNGTCCIIARMMDDEGAGSPSNFAFLRKTLAGVIPAADSVRTFAPERIEALRMYLRYLTTSERGKINPEVVVRRIDRSIMSMRTWNNDAGWDDLLIPPDVVASILRKLSARLRPLREVATVSGGLRTGANDILAPHLDEIVGDDLEERFWQHQRDDGSMVDNIVITSTDELTSISGIPNADRRLLVLSDSRSDLAGTNVLTRIEKAERDGVHARPTVRNRDPWWHLGTIISPHLLIPRDQHHRWLVTVNTAGCFATDACIEILLDKPEHAQPLALWMNSSLGLFLSGLVQRSAHAKDVTVRDVQEFPVPDDDILQFIDAKRYRELMYRPMRSITEEFGTEDADVVRPHLVRKDRRRLDVMFMQDIFGLTDEEQRWVYRFALAWRHASSNIRHLAAALATEAEVRSKIRPMREWYTPRIEQLPQGASRTIILPQKVTRAEFAQSMFTPQVTLFRGTKREDVTDCTTAEEAELIALLVNLGKRSIELPTDTLLIAEVLPLVRAFTTDLDRVVADLTSIVPEDLQETVGAEMRDVLRS